jgi:hypothetical protein
MEIVAGERFYYNFPGSLLARMVFPDSGGPIIMTLWPPAAGVSRAGLAFSWSRTSLKSVSANRRRKKAVDVHLHVHDIGINADDSSVLDFCEHRQSPRGDLFP